jgi:hypothetical protein
MNANSKNKLYFLIGLMLAFPTAYFIFINILNELGYNYLFDSIWPALQSWGIQEPIGWNINLLILIGPVLALFLNVVSVLHIRFGFSKEKIDCRLTISKSWLNLAVVFLSGTVLAILGMYLFLENCN